MKAAFRGPARIVEGATARRTRATTEDDLKTTLHESARARLPIGDASVVAASPLVDALLWLASSSRVELRRPDAELELARAAAGARAATDVVADAGEALGLRIRVLEVACADLAAGSARELLPALAIGDDARGIAVVNAGRGRATVVEPGSDGAGSKVTIPALAAMLGMTSTTAPVKWLVADPKQSLDVLRPGGDGHGHMSPQRRLWELLRLERDDAWVAVVYATGVGVLSIATPLGVQVLVNTVAFGALVQPLVVLTLLVALGLVVAGTLRALQAYVVERLQQRVFARVALDLAHRLPRVRVEALDGAHGPELVNRFFDVVTLQKGASTLLVDGTSVVLQTLVGLVLLAFYHPYLLAFDAFLLGSLVVVVFVVGRGAVPSAIAESKKKYELAAWLQETIRHVHGFKLLGGEQYAHARAEALTRDYVTTRRKHFGIVFRQYTGALVIQAIASAVLLGVGGALVIGRQLTLGQLVAAELIVTAVVAGFSKVGKYFETYYDLVAATEKIGHLVDLPVERTGGLELPAREIGLSVRAHGVAIRRGDRELLRDVELTLPPGATVGICGANGRGKSMLVDVLCGVREASSGRIDVDGIDARELAPSSLRRRIAVLRDNDIFHGTIAENLQLGRLDVSRHDVRKALEALGAWNVVSSLPDGLDTMLATRGAGLPSGLVSLLLVARALVGGPRMLVIDGVLDTLDERAQRAVREALAGIAPACSVVVATTDAQLLRGCRAVYELEGGTVRLRSPSHEEAR